MVAIMQYLIIGVFVLFGVFTKLYFENRLERLMRFGFAAVFTGYVVVVLTWPFWFLLYFTEFVFLGFKRVMRK